MLEWVLQLSYHKSSQCSKFIQQRHRAIICNGIMVVAALELWTRSGRKAALHIVPIEQGGPERASSLSKGNDNREIEPDSNLAHMAQN
jgi:hypothetical protein